MPKKIDFKLQLAKFFNVTFICFLEIKVLPLKKNLIHVYKT